MVMDPEMVGSPEQLGSPAFRRRHRLAYAYLAGSMYKGIASKELVVRLGKAGLLGFLGTGGLQLERIEADLLFIQHELQARGAYGLNLLASPMQPGLEEATVDLYLRHKRPRIPPTAFTHMPSPLLPFRVKSL